MRKLKKTNLTVGSFLLVIFCLAHPLHASEHPVAHAGEVYKSGHSVETEKPESHHPEAEVHTAAATHPKHAGGHEPGSHTKVNVHAKPKEGHGGGHHAGNAPVVYYANWVLIAVTFIITCFYCLAVYKWGKPKHEGLLLAMFLVLLVIAIYGTAQFPQVQRHFDPTAHKFVDGYHESSIVGFIKFIYKFALGICLMIYGLIGREDHH